MVHRAGILLTVACVGLFNVQSQTISLDWATNKHPLEYQVGEKIDFAVQLFTNATPWTMMRLDWTRTGDDGITEHGRVTTGSTSVVIRTQAAQAGFVRIEIIPYDATGQPLKDPNKARTIKFEGGAAVHPETLKPTAEPADFDTFWNTQKAALAKIPMTIERVAIAHGNATFNVYDVKISCAGSKPVSGYLSIPHSAKQRSLPVNVSFKGYSVSGADPACINNQITFAINAHGIENGKSKEYYQALEAGELKGYAFRATENALPENAYFLGMFLRVMRAIDYVQTLPEWDQTHLSVSGGSQGGFQALAAAALRSDVVTSCAAYKPWCCDLSGVTQKRLSGWRPAYTPALAYFDGVNMARRIRCKTLITCGLGDYVCPPSGLVTLYNTLTCSKKIEFYQGVTHEGATPPCPRVPEKFTWEKSE